jgi:hypothetical protein
MMVRKLLSRCLTKIFLVPYMGSRFATAYFSFVGKLCRDPLNPRFYGLAYLPGECRFRMKIYRGINPYSYLTSPGDALNLDSRTSFNEWEVESRNLWRILARTSKLCLDVGAYSGVYSMEACSVNSDLKVMAFEPNPYMRVRLDSNIAINNFLQLFKSIVLKRKDCFL